METDKYFEDELHRRGMTFSIVPATGQYRVDIDRHPSVVCIDNLRRDVARDGNFDLVSTFIDLVISSNRMTKESFSVEGLFWCLEPSDYVESDRIQYPIGDRSVRILEHMTSDMEIITWVNASILENVGLLQSKAEVTGFENLAKALLEATLETDDIDGATIGYFDSPLPFKASLMLAPNLKEIVESHVGWPLLAVAPARDFLLFWDASHRFFLDRVGGTVLRNYSESPYPISPELFEIDDEGIHVIGEFQ